jgi:hypothetical protein
VNEVKPMIDKFDADESLNDYFGLFDVLNEDLDWAKGCFAPISTHNTSPAVDRNKIGIRNTNDDRDLLITSDRTTRVDK